MQSNFRAGSKNLDQHKTFWDLQKDKALVCCIFAIRDANAINSYQSARFGLFVVFTGGSLFWYTYNAFLTSSLAVPAKHLPFTSPEGILNTDYR